MAEKMFSEKGSPQDNTEPLTDSELAAEGESDDQEVFKVTKDGVNFRTVGWFKACVIFAKVMFAVGVLSLPSCMYALGAIGGSLSIIAWGLFNTYTFIILGEFRTTHPGCHSIVDMAGVVGGVVVKEMTGILFIFAYVLSAGSGIIGVATGLNALSHHAACTVWWAFIAMIVIALAASIRKLQHVGWLTYAGFVSIYVAILVVVIGVTQRDRPAAAPQEGPYELGYYAIRNPGFAAGMVASSTIFYSSAGTSAFLPVISEMRNPKDYKKSLYLCMTVVTGSYLCFSLVVYRWCGQWVATPSLGSAGQTVKMVAYGIALLGLVVSACIYLHCLLPLALRKIHLCPFASCIIALSAIAFIFAEAIPIFNFLNALTGSICFAPLGMMLPGWFWLYDHGHYRKGSVMQQLIYWLHWGMILMGIFFLVGATYGVILEINEAYADGTIGSAFSCADNSNSS
ncbi:hypothetical protein B7463_g7359, partial [Scytalidium lignicola]